IGLPKLYSPVVKGGLGGRISFSARLSAPATWRVTVWSEKIVARGSGFGTVVRWTWSSAGASRAIRYRWTIEAGVHVRPAGGTIAFAWAPDALADGHYTLDVSGLADDGRNAELEASFAVDRTLGSLTATPPVFSPNGDGQNDTIAFGFALTKPATVTVEVRE